MGTAWQIGFGNSASPTPIAARRTPLTLTPRSPLVGGIIATFSFLSKDAPKYIPGYSICIAFIAFSFLSCVAYFASVTWENRRRDRLQAEGAFDRLSAEEKKQMGDLDPDYRYFR